ncbi:MAG: thiolase domain-containing protein [Candidatus Berkelbacteria bacterium]|nr:thiolase domain-containing protein [Candidatus Berkelbacteria bacterium]
MKIGIVGTGHTKFGKSEQNIEELMLEATNQALLSAKTDIEKIDVIYVANLSSSFSHQCHLPAVLASALRVNKEIIRVESACASGGLAIKEAAIAIASGLYKTALVVGVEKMTETPIDETTAILASAASQTEIRHGATFPSLFALMAQRHFYKYHTTEKDLAQIALKNHHNAFLNPLAHFHKEVTVDDVLKSRVIASPLKLLDCSAISDGAAAVVMCSEETAPYFKSEPIYLIGIGHNTDFIGIYDREDLTQIPSVKKAAQKAYLMSGKFPKDIDVAELHDCFTIAELIEMEDLGFCDKGKAAEMIAKGETQLVGKLPINPSGGLKAKGHPIGATGVSQVVEIVKQLQGTCGKRQAKKADIGLTCNVGGSGATAIVNILSR